MTAVMHPPHCEWRQATCAVVWAHTCCSTWIEPQIFCSAHREHLLARGMCLKGHEAHAQCGLVVVEVQHRRGGQPTLIHLHQPDAAAPLVCVATGAPEMVLAGPQLRCDVILRVQMRRQPQSCGNLLQAQLSSHACSHAAVMAHTVAGTTRNELNRTQERSRLAE
jgi:hypothetical protein